MNGQENNSYLNQFYIIFFLTEPRKELIVVVKIISTISIVYHFQEFKKKNISLNVQISSERLLERLCSARLSFSKCAGYFSY